MSDYLNPWLFKDEVVSSEMLKPFEGFVYIITDTVTHQSYIGKKFIWSMKKVKDKTRRQKSEADWKKYYSSHVFLKTEGKKDPLRFKRVILHLCATRGETNFLEIEEQFKRDVLYSEEYMNDNINRKVV